RIPEEHRTANLVSVLRGSPGHKRRALFVLPLRARLPVLPIPLRYGEKPVPLDLQALMDQCYRNGRYERTIDYRKDCMPPLSAEDAAWADELLREAGRR